MPTYTAHPDNTNKFLVDDGATKVPLDGHRMYNQWKSALREAQKFAPSLIGAKSANACPAIVCTDTKMQTMLDAIDAYFE